MSDGEFGTKRRGDERLMRACGVAGRLCAERPSATARLEAQLGAREARGLVLALTAGAPVRSVRRSSAAVHVLAA